NGIELADVMMIVAIDALYNLPKRGLESAAAASSASMLRSTPFSVKREREGGFRQGEVLAAVLPKASCRAPL
ncbi:MAG: hypothetical protein ACXVH6_06585, partial [Halobacteriota archaeon]